MTSRRRVRAAGSDTHRRITRPLIFGIACTALCVFVAHPAYAEPIAPPGNVAVAPVPAAAQPLIDTSSSGAPLQRPFTPFPASLGPLAASIFAREAQVEGLAQQVDAAQQQVATQVTATNNAYAAWQAAVANTTAATTRAANAAAEEYEHSTELGPLAPYRSDLQQLNLLAPGLLPVPPNAEPAGVDVTTAKQNEQTAYEAYTTALSEQERLQSQASTIQLQFEAQNAVLTDLKTQNSAALAAAEAEQAQIDQNIGAQLRLSVNVDGRRPSPQALEAIAFAMKQLGKPYVFGAEGPNSYDCSGLVWAAYGSAGITLPRIARDQEHATTPIGVDQLLPGDLVFFSTTSNTDWRQITHVGMYIGNGKMIEAPMTGENVKIAPVWWSAFFAATRVVPALGPSTPTSPGRPGGSGSGPTPPTTPPTTPPPGQGPTPPPSSGSPSPSGPPLPTPPPHRPPTTPPPSSPPPSTPPPPPPSSSTPSPSPTDITPSATDTTPASPPADTSSPSDVSPSTSATPLPSGVSPS